MKILFPEKNGEFERNHADSRQKTSKPYRTMIIRDEKEYKEYEGRVEALLEKGTELGDMELLSEEEKSEFAQLSTALDEYGRAYHPLPGQMSTLLADAILLQVKEKGLKQKEAARMIGISATTFSDLLHGRRSLSFDVARSLYKVLGVPAEVVLA